MVFNSDHPNPTRIGGRKKARVFAISKPDKGIFYLTITYDVDEELETNYKALTRMLKFN